MPRTCAIEKCKRKSRSTCTCCNKNLCQDHLKEHEDINNPQLNPLINEFNILDEQLKSSNTEKLIGDCRQKLVQWRDNSYKIINQLYEKKMNELDQRCSQKLDEQRSQLSRIRSKMSEIIHQQEVTPGNTDAATPVAIRHIHDEIKNIENTHLEIDIRPITLDDSFIFIEEVEPNQCSLVNITTPQRTIDCSGEWGPALVSNNRYLLIDRHPNLCLINQQLQVVKQSPWKFDFIRDMCWSKTLNSFIVTTRSREIYIVNESTLATELIQTIEEQDWSSCTCSNMSLYLTARREGTNVFEFNLLSSFELVKRWKPPHSCKHYEVILNAEYKNEALALVISHSSTNLVHLELRSSRTFDRLWSLELNVSHTIGQPLIRCSSLKCDEWLIVDNNTSQLFHIRKDGQIKAVSSCNPPPWNAVIFGSNVMAIRTKNSVNFHKL